MGSIGRLIFRLKVRRISPERSGALTPEQESRFADYCNIGRLICV